MVEKFERLFRRVWLPKKCTNIILYVLLVIRASADNLSILELRQYKNELTRNQIVASFDTAALFSRLYGEGKCVAIAKLANILAPSSSTYIVLELRQFQNK